MAPARVKLKWLTVWAPAAFILLPVISLLMHHSHPLAVWMTNLFVVAGLGLAGAYFFSSFVFSQIQCQEEEILRRSEAMAAINAIGTDITGLSDLEKILHAVVGAARKLMGTEVSALCFVSEKNCPVPKVLAGPPEAFAVSGNRLNSSGCVANCLAAPVLSASQGEAAVECSGIKPEYTKAHLAAPLTREGHVIGALCVAGRSPRHFLPLEVELLTRLATRAAVAIENARLHERLRDVAVIEERHRIAREMHDGLAQALGYLDLKIGELEAAVSLPPATLRTELGRMKKVVAGAYEEVRQAIFGLKMTPPRGLGLVPTLAEYLREFSEQTGTTVELKLADEEGARLSPRAELQLIRIIQEALANVRKHAQAGRAWVTFDTEEGKAKITVQDDGRGFDPEEAARPGRTPFGLRSMRERAESVGGTLAVEPGQGRGTQVIIRLPLGGQEGAAWRP
jgi:signal transduction histidine kinase